MAAAETARLVAELSLKDNFTKGLRTAGSNLDGFSRKLASSRAVAVGFGVGLERVAEKGISALGNAIGDGIQSALTLEKAQAQTQAVIKSTGNAAGVTAQQVRDLANAQEDISTVDDKTVQQAENLLLTFTSIGKDVFPAATAAATNMAIAFNKGDASTADLDSAAIQLGKALNDPASGFTALKRAGVSFNQAQIKTLKGTNDLNKAETKQYNTLLKTDKKAAERFKQQTLHNKLLASQKLILAELDKEFGKAGAAAGTGFAADISRANDAIEDAKIAIAQGLIPAVGEVARALSTTLKDPQVMQGLKDLGTNIGAGIKGALAFAKSIPWDKVGQGLSIAAEAAKTVVSAFTSLPPWVQAAVISGWGLNKLTGGALGDLFGTLASGLIKGVLGMNAGVVNLTAATVVGGPGNVPVPGGGPGTIASILSTVLGPIGIVSTIAAATAKQITDDFNTNAGTTITFPQGFGGIPASLDLISQGINLLINGHPLNTNDDGTQGDIEKLRGTIADGLKPNPGGGDKPGAMGHTPGDTQSGMEGQRGNMADRLSADEIGNAVKQGVGPDIEAVRAITASGLTDTQAAIETARGDLVNGLSDTTTQVSLSGQQVGQDAIQAGNTAAIASQSAASRIIGGFSNIPAPIVKIDFQVTGASVQKTNTVTTRQGPSGGSRDDDLRDYPH